MKKLSQAEETSIDRWKVQVDPYRHYGIQLPSHTFYMQNYVSIGVDALVTFNFHKARESPFYLISSRIINKLIYFR
jgi:diacylglycerol kinase (ATP)